MCCVYYPHGLLVILHYLKGFFLMSMQVRNKNCGRSFYWIFYNREIQYKGSNKTSILSYFICQLNHIIIINVNLIVLCGCFWPFCGPIVLFTIFVNQLHVIWHLNLYSYVFFPYGFTWLLSLCSTSFFFRLVLMGEKHIIIYFFNGSMEHGNKNILLRCVYCPHELLICDQTTLFKRIFFCYPCKLITQIVLGGFFQISHNIEIPYNGGNIT